MSFYGRSDSTGGLLHVAVDGVSNGVDTGATDFGNGQPIFVSKNLPDGDHQLVGTTDVNAKNNTDVWVDYIVCVSPKTNVSVPLGLFLL